MEKDLSREVVNRVKLTQFTTFGSFRDDFHAGYACYAAFAGRSTGDTRRRMRMASHASRPTIANPSTARPMRSAVVLARTNRPIRIWQMTALLARASRWRVLQS